MSEPDEVLDMVNRFEFLKTARALLKAWPKRLLGEITISPAGGSLTIESEWGGCHLQVKSTGKVSARLSATAFSKLTASYGHVPNPQGEMPVVFRPGLKEPALDRTGINARAVCTG